MKKKFDPMFRWRRAKPFEKSFFGWRADRLKPWKDFFKIDWMALLMVLTVVFCYLYMTTANSECKAILDDPSLYCPCLGDSVLPDYLLEADAIVNNSSDELVINIDDLG